MFRSSLVFIKDLTRAATSGISILIRWTGGGAGFNFRSRLANLSSVYSHIFLPWINTSCAVDCMLLILSLYNHISVLPASTWYVSSFISSIINRVFRLSSFLFLVLFDFEVDNFLLDFEGVTKSSSEWFTSEFAVLEVEEEADFMVVV